MRQGQQSRRGRGRGRKVQNPLSRNYESNGPDVKIRGTAAHIAEKYTTLARDAMASGDVVTAENFYQHAEHYNRIIQAAQAQYATTNQPSGDAANGSGNQRGRRRPEQSSDETAKAEEEATTDNDSKAANKNAAPQEAGEPEKAAAPARGRRKSNGAEPAKTPANSNGAASEVAPETSAKADDGPSDGPVA